MSEPPWPNGTESEQRERRGPPEMVDPLALEGHLMRRPWVTVDCREGCVR